MLLIPLEGGLGFLFKGIWGTLKGMGFGGSFKGLWGSFRDVGCLQKGFRVPLKGLGVLI